MTKCVCMPVTIACVYGTQGGGCTGLYNVLLMLNGGLKIGGGASTFQVRKFYWTKMFSDLCDVGFSMLDHSRSCSYLLPGRCHSELV